MTAEQRAFWDRFCAETGYSGEPVDVDQFGDSEAMADELLHLVLTGQKQATCALARWYEQPGARFPEPGDLSVILDGRGQPACVIRTTKAEVKPVREADADFAWIEGEGDRSFEYWWDAHIAYWKREAKREGFEFSEDLPACFEQFELAWVPDQAERA
ncbi:ASCH domain-containing protein [Hyphobacterium sp. HN65]|uniref:ASCH domain-containing protein n=1 Tax=Hyphobacterium lacteum TaxID=3116575 RepID=A0ABU7LR60_9PROT|nr:ASCH domain-containing protein [Hyphobacterium sp. HN65]MEE2525809.1 ASCH domain-containing protein [Hyphobacterium sp. HN65]